MDCNHLFDGFALTPLDYLNTELFIPYSTLFRVQDPDQALKHISHGITRLTSRIPFLTGEVVPSTRFPGKKSVFEVRPCDTATQTWVPMLQVKYYPNFTSPFKTFDRANTPPISYAALDESYSPLPMTLPSSQPRPLVRFQANMIADGVLLTMAFNHLVFDGIGANVILKHLAQCCCNSSSEERDATAYEEIRYRKLILDMEPIHRRDSGVHASVASSLCLACLSPQVRSDMAKVLPQQLSDECFIFSPDSINRLKDACSYLWPLLQGSCPSPSDTPTPPILSENDVVTALLWGSIAKARGSNNNREQQAKYQAKSVCAMAVNLRRFFEPCLPPTYMGNAITTVRYLVDSNTFRHQETGHSQLGKDTESLFGIRLDSILPIAKIAYGIRSRRCAFNGLYAQNLIAFIRSNGISDAIRNGPADIYVTSWRRLEIYELDFGSHLGHIDGFHTQASGVDGMCLIMPARASQSAGSTARQNNQQIPWDVRITLNTETMELFRNDDLMCWVLEGGECSLPGKDKLELR